MLPAYNLDKHGIYSYVNTSDHTKSRGGNKKVCNKNFDEAYTNLETWWKWGWKFMAQI
jgi:hypothetical protein